jgi:hypothetical protein
MPEFHLSEKMWTVAERLRQQIQDSFAGLSPIIAEDFALIKRLRDSVGGQALSTM